MSKTNKGPLVRRDVVIPLALLLGLLASPAVIEHLPTSAQNWVILIGAVVITYIVVNRDRELIREADFLLTQEDGRWMLTPLTKSAQNWAKDNLHCYSTYGRSYIVDADTTNILLLAIEHSNLMVATPPQR